jgi:hypothetical protein
VCCVLETPAGDVLVASGEDGADDDVRERMAKAMVSTACLHSCWSEDEGWLEREAASGDNGRR